MEDEVDEVELEEREVRAEKAKVISHDWRLKYAFGANHVSSLCHTRIRADGSHQWYDLLVLLHPWFLSLSTRSTPAQRYRNDIPRTKLNIRLDHR